MNITHPRIQRERDTIQRMVSIYCQQNHRPAGQQLCAECRTLQDYALERLHRCPFQENKPTCAKCIIHCYRLPRREQIRQVMRYSGPRMILYHPILAIQHLLDGRKKPPILKRPNPQQ